MATKKPVSRKTVPAKKTDRKTAPAREKTTAKKGAARKARSGSQATGLRVKVRMYRQGLGDCFLLTFPSSSGQPFYLLIDCGVLVGTENGAERMKNVVKDVIATTGGRLDLVVATHQHWDHLSGFVQARELFAAPDEPAKGKLQVDGLWLAWTEDPANRLANHLRAKRSEREQALRATVQGLRAMGADAEREQALRTGVESEAASGAGGDGADGADSRHPSLQAADHVEDLLGFFGAAGGASTEDALANIKSFTRTPPRFCHPKNDPIALAEVPGVRFFVLGPPEDEKLIKRSDPSHSHPEVYEEPSRALNLANAFFAAAAALPGGELDPMREQSLPFDRCYQIPVDQAQQIRFFQRFYFAEDEEADLKDQSWRWIGGDWVDVANQLALQLDSDTNNTSLALAIELVDSGKVLLFPADAQVGNWLSWSDLSWKVADREVSGPELLRRAVLYKVGHHASHNATLREKGLELMESGDLIALIPVHQAMAKKKRWNMPFPPLLNRLLEKTGGRVLRVDDAENIKKRQPPTGISASRWREFVASVEDTELYYEVTIGG